VALKPMKDLRHVRNRDTHEIWHQDRVLCRCRRGDTRRRDRVSFDEARSRQTLLGARSPGKLQRPLVDACVLGEVDFVVDGKPLDFADTVVYRGMMFTGVPDMVWIFGHFCASWTLRVDLFCDFVWRLRVRKTATWLCCRGWILTISIPII